MRAQTSIMINHLFVALSAEGRVVRFAQDSDTGELDPVASFDTPGGPAPIAISPAGDYLYVGRRAAKQLSAYRLDRASGEVELVGETALRSDSNYLATDTTGGYVFSAYYTAGACAVHRVGTDRAPTEVVWIATGSGAHCMHTDPSNRFAILNHVAEPDHHNRIYQYRFDASTGALSPNDPASLIPSAAAVGPRHLCFHPALPTLYTSNEQGCSVTAYAFDREAGTLSEVQTLSTLPTDYTGENTCSQIRMDTAGRFLYIGNRGHDSVASFAIDAESGALRATGHAPTDPLPRPLNVAPDGRFLYVAGTETGRINCYAIDQQEGALTRGTAYLAGADAASSPMWIALLDAQEASA